VDIEEIEWDYLAQDIVHFKWIFMRKCDFMAQDNVNLEWILKKKSGIIWLGIGSSDQILRR